MTGQSVFSGMKRKWVKTEAEGLKADERIPSSGERSLKPRTRVVEKRLGWPVLKTCLPPRGHGFHDHPNSINLMCPIIWIKTPSAHRATSELPHSGSPSRNQGRGQRQGRRCDEQARRHTHSLQWPCGWVCCCSGFATGSPG